MPPLAHIRQINAAFSPSYTPVAIFVGGTSGIGQGMAELFGQLTKGNAKVVIVGRNRGAAESVISTLPKPAASEDDSDNEPRHEFIQCDATLMKNVDSATKYINSRYRKVNFLVLSPGFSSMKGLDETEESIDRKLALSYYARWKFIKDLLPTLTKANVDGEDAKVFSVLGAGKGGEIDVNDLGLKKSYSIMTSALASPTYNDLMMEEFAAQNPNLTFIHGYPGLVRTNFASSSPSPIIRATSGLIYTLAYPFSISKEVCAEYMWGAIFSHTTGAFRTGSHGENLQRQRYFGNEEQRKKLWDHTSEVTKLGS